ncbi:MAG: sigma-70 family RNA polymerase sigma factor [Planctomycetaceae bacterium]|nr:sigma-70 family RNA polymerase sigma factor [Planctomycetaceae bacterium]
MNSSSRDPQLAQQFAAARQGSTEALGALLECCRQYLLLIAQSELDSRLRVKTAPSDLVQETFIEARQAFGEFSGTSLPELTAWLRQILLFKLSGSRRRYRGAQKRDLRREVSLHAGDSRLGPAEALQLPDARQPQLDLRAEAELLGRALSRLSDDYRRVIELRHREGLAFEEIGRRLGRSAVAAQRLWARAVRRLREEVESEE